MFTGFIHCSIETLQNMVSSGENISLPDTHKAEKQRGVNVCKL